jgi:hypothetical protein
MLLWAGGGKGKTNLSGELHEMTMKFWGKPTLYIAIEAGEGGGAATIRKMGVPLVTPQSVAEMDKILAGLETDTEFGGVVLDSSSEMVKKFIKPEALAFPCRERGSGQELVRKAGVPSRSDYQTMGELCRQRFQRLINLSSHTNPKIKKHVIITALDRQHEDDTGKTDFWGPDLPGAIATGAVGMFQIVATVDIKPQVVGGKRFNTRFLVTGTDGVKSLKDRFNVFPAEVKLKNTVEVIPGDDGLTLSDCWERYWVPAIEESQRGGTVNVEVPRAA